MYIVVSNCLDCGKKVSTGNRKLVTLHLKNVSKTNVSKIWCYPEYYLV